MNYKPQRTKYAKSHKGRLSSIPKICSLAFGRYGLVAREPCRLKASHLAAAELAIKRKFKREAKVWLRVFPHLPVTRKPAEVRMGKGKGNVDF
jgi:large subunit ribosomal protein L16